MGRRRSDDPLELVRDAGDVSLWFLAVYAEPDVITRYAEPVQPAGERERRPFGR
jgi:hypothetical protein